MDRWTDRCVTGRREALCGDKHRAFNASVAGHCKEEARMLLRDSICATGLLSLPPSLLFLFCAL